MSDENVSWVDEIKERLEKATTGPWNAMREQNQISDTLGDIVVGANRFYVVESVNDQIFIANAPTDIGNLLKEREVLREALETYCPKEHRKVLVEELRLDVICGYGWKQDAYCKTDTGEKACEALDYDPRKEKE